MPTVVIDTNVFWSLPSFAAVALRVVRACLSSQYQPLLGPALLAEYEDVLGRGDLFVTGVPTVAERQEVSHINDPERRILWIAMHPVLKRPSCGQGLVRVGQRLRQKPDPDGPK